MYGTQPDLMPFPTISSDKASFSQQLILKKEIYKGQFLNTVLPTAGILRSCPKNSLCKWYRYFWKCYNCLFTVTFILYIFNTWTLTYFQLWQFLVNFYLLGLLNFDLCTQITEPLLIPVLITLIRLSCINIIIIIIIIIIIRLFWTISDKASFS